MNNAIVRSQHHHALLPSIGTFPARISHKVGIGRIVAVCVESETPLLVRLANGTTFHLGGLSNRQKNQLVKLSSSLINTRVRFKYTTQNDHGQAVDAVFQTIFIYGDTRSVQGAA